MSHKKINIPCPDVFSFIAVLVQTLGELFGGGGSGRQAFVVFASWSALVALLHWTGHGLLLNWLTDHPISEAAGSRAAASRSVPQLAAAVTSEWRDCRELC